MRRVNSINTALLTAILIVVLSCAAFAERLFECRAEFLRLDANRLYVWIDGSVTVNHDFSMEVTHNGVQICQTRISGVLDKVAISSALPSDIVELLLSKKDCAFSVSLESEVVCDSLVIAMPANLRELWLDTLFTTNDSPPIRYFYRYYDDIKEVEIAAKLRQVDLLIMPEFEVPEAPVLADSPYQIEWNLIGASIKDDLLATALNDCVRGLFANNGDSAYSSLILPRHLKTIFPQNPDHARELFSQSKKTKDKFDCYFPGFKMYPVLSDRFNSALDSCSGRKFTFRDSGSQPLSLNIIALDSHNDPSTDCAQAIRQIADPIRATLALNSSSSLDSCLLGLLAPDSCCESLSRAVTESVRIVPLGRSRLAIKHFDHVRWLDRHSGAADLSDFYTVKR